MLASDAGNGDAFTLGALSFTGSITHQEKPDGIGGRFIETTILALRSAFSALPVEGDIVTQTATSAKYRVLFCRPNSGGYFNIHVGSELR